MNPPRSISGIVQGRAQGSYIARPRDGHRTFAGTETQKLCIYTTNACLCMTGSHPGRSRGAGISRTCSTPRSSTSTGSIPDICKSPTLASSTFNTWLDQVGAQLACLLARGLPHCPAASYLSMLGEHQRSCSSKYRAGLCMVASYICAGRFSCWLLGYAGFQLADAKTRASRGVGNGGYVACICLGTQCSWERSAAMPERMPFAQPCDVDLIMRAHPTVGYLFGHMVKGDHGTFHRKVMKLATRP
jgi:hypothetical protein